MQTTGIYILKFPNNGGVYIGQSIDIEARIRRHIKNMQNGVASKKLMLAYNTFGAPNGSILLECPISLINEAENLFIKLYDSCNKGYNTNSTAEQSPIKYAEKNPSICKTTDKAVAVLKELIKTSKPDLLVISKSLNVKLNTVKNIYRGRGYTWLAKEYAEEYSKMILNKKELMSKKFYNKTDIIKAFLLYINNPELSVTEIEKLTGIPRTYVSSIGTGSTNKWLKTEYPDKFALIPEIVKIRNCISKNNPRKTLPNLVSPEGDIITINKTQSAFAKEHNLDQSGLSRLLSKKIDVYKGWKLA